MSLPGVYKTAMCLDAEAVILEVLLVNEKMLSGDLELVLIPLGHMLV